jgi:hypothetical protein
VEEEHAALQLGLQQTISVVHAVAQCVICFGTMEEASTVSGCGHTFCCGCIVKAVRAKICCCVCTQPAWNYEVRSVTGMWERPAKKTIPPKKGTMCADQCMAIYHTRVTITAQLNSAAVFKSRILHIIWNLLP